MKLQTDHRPGIMARFHELAGDKIWPGEDRLVLAEQWPEAKCNFFGHNIPYSTTCDKMHFGSRHCNSRTRHVFALSARHAHRSIPKLINTQSANTNTRPESNASQEHKK